jgi:hypothetical protein
VAQDDNSGGGTNAKIARTLTAGTYTIEATTALASQLGLRAGGRELTRRPVPGVPTGRGVAASGRTRRCGAVRRG